MSNNMAMRASENANEYA